MDFECDIAIIGGGPAGSAAALTLLKMRPGLNIVLFEATQYDQFRPGETLSPPLTALLKELGCTTAFPEEDFIPSPGTRSSWGGQQSENDFLFFTNGTGWHVRRERFDKMLADLAQKAGARIVTGITLHLAGKGSPPDKEKLSGKGPESDNPVSKSFGVDSHWHLLLKEQASGSILTCRTSWVIDASGRKASFARRAGARMIKMDKLCSVTRIYQQHTPSDNDLFTEIEATKEGWWYSSPVPGNKLVVSWMSDTDLVKSQRMDQPAYWEAALSKAPASFARLLEISPSIANNPGGPKPVSTNFGNHPSIAGNLHTAAGPLHIYPADTRLLSSFSGDHWIAVGDACYTVDPLSGQGILKALRSGRIAAYAIIDERTEKGSGLPKFNLFTRKEFQSYLNQRWAFYREGVPPANPTANRSELLPSLFWKRRTSPLTISPYAILRTTEKDSSAATGIDCPLMPAEWEGLLACLGQGKLTAVEGIRKFQTIEGQSVSDERLIAGLQYFLQAGALEIVYPKSIPLLNT